jgi:hypothetical protein
MTISCPRCGLAFDTRATTNTRCRRCKTVVRVGSGHARRFTGPTEPAPYEPTAELAGVGILVIAAGVVILALYVGRFIVWAVRSRRGTEAPTFATSSPYAVPATSPPAAEDDGTRAHTGPNAARSIRRRRALMAIMAACGVSEATASVWRSGRNVPPLRHWEALHALSGEPVPPHL